MEFDSKIDNNRLTEELGVEITPFETGLRRTLAWYREHGYLSVDRPRTPVGDETGLSRPAETD